MGTLANPEVRLLVLGSLAMLAIGVGLLAAVMALGLVGIGLFAVGDRVVGWLARLATWPDEPPG